VHRVTLTFDNGPSVDVTPFVLDQLASRDLSAWFCVVGRQLRLEGGPETVRAALDAGHRIANHSSDHETPLGERPTADHARREIEEMHELMDERLGDWGERWFRPFGRGGRLGKHVFSEPALDRLEGLDYSVLLWNSVPRDWEETDGWVTTALNDITTNDHTVMVLHDVPTGAMTNLPRFLAELAERDIEVTLDPPSSCVPIRDGIPQWDLGNLTQ
jgi:peptidoglycan-N-acetylglucosamine deacetylase